MRLCRRSMVALLLVATSVSAHAGQQGDEWIRRSVKLAVQRLLVPAHHLSLEYPKKDWVVLPAGGSMLVSLAEKNGLALVQLEHETLRQPLGPEEITELFAEIEVDTIRQRHADATGFVSRLAMAGSRRVAMLEYERPGTLAIERVRQYSIPVGATLFRLICAAPAAQFARVEQVFAHMAASLTIEGME